jgi:hypothetical protein
LPYLKNIFTSCSALTTSNNLPAGTASCSAAAQTKGASGDVVLPPGHHGARFFNLSKIDILNFQKIGEKFTHVDNHEFYLHAKNQSKILCILACIKKTNFQI